MTVPIPQPAAAYPFDSRPLTDPVDRAALAAYVRQAKASGNSGGQASAARGVAFVVIAFGVFAAVFAVVVSTSLRGFATLLFTVLPVLVVVGVLVGVVVWFRRARTREYRLATFASTNGMTYLAGLDDPQLPGMIFDQGHSRKARDLVRGATPRFVEFANFQYTTGSGKNAQTHTWGYIAIRLDVPLPNIVLDSLANNSVFGSNLPERYEKHQRLALEGDFDRSFALYCPTGYERDALYLFTPDIMARFMDNAATFDVEIVDDWLLLYAQRQEVSTLDPATWARMFATVSAVIDKLAQWGRWRDERLRAAPGGLTGTTPAGAGSAAAPMAFAGDVAAPTPGAPGQTPWSPPPGVAAPGRRLKRTSSWVGLVFFLIFAGFWLIPKFFGH
ncbi:hypothetical protein [Microbacterium panaciterrae]|uniref:DUF3137 domain-containing protein n=1 Tax=Microbacterium panaciterrae TaxID=985759 RepID=A0ABP8PS71_9MICO